MGNSKEYKTSLQVVNIPDHTESTCKRQNNATGVILPTGAHHYLISGKVATVEEFDEAFPIVPLKDNINQFGGSLDGRQIQKH